MLESCWERLRLARNPEDSTASFGQDPPTTGEGEFDWTLDMSLEIRDLDLLGPSVFPILFWVF